MHLADHLASNKQPLVYASQHGVAHKDPPGKAGVSFMHTYGGPKFGARNRHDLFVLDRLGVFA